MVICTLTDPWYWVGIEMVMMVICTLTDTWYWVGIELVVMVICTLTDTWYWVGNDVHLYSHWHVVLSWYWVADTWWAPHVGVCKSCYSTATDEEVEGQYAAFFYLWVASAFASTCYTFIWDVKMDWGLFDKSAGENRLLREEIVYSRKVCCSRTRTRACKCNV